MVQRKINRGRHTDHPAGRHSIRANQCPPPPSPHIFLQAGCPSYRPTNSIKALKATALKATENTKTENTKNIKTTQNKNIQPGNGEGHTIILT